jgi:predicted nucleic acid-binding protein
MAVLIDTNVLLRSTQPHDSHYLAAENAVSALGDAEEPMTVAVQNLIEFWVVATRPVKSNRLGMSLETASAELASFKNMFRILPESDQILPEWEELVRRYGVSGKNAHDARLVAVMNVNGVDKILTFNTSDFTRFREIQVLDPQSFGSGTEK